MCDFCLTTSSGTATTGTNGRPTAVEPLSAALQRIVAERVAEAEERAWHDGWAAGWRRCAEKVAAEIEADAGSHECAWGFDAVEIAHRIGGQAEPPARTPRTRTTEARPGHDTEGEPR